MSKNPIHKLIASIVNRLSQGSVKEVEDGITSSAEMASLCRNAVRAAQISTKRSQNAIGNGQKSIRPTTGIGGIGPCVMTKCP